MKNFVAILMAMVMVTIPVWTAYADDDYGYYDYDFMESMVLDNDMESWETDNMYASISSYGDYRILRLIFVDDTNTEGSIWWVSYDCKKAKPVLFKGWIVNDTNAFRMMRDYYDSTYAAMAAIYWMTEVSEMRE